MVIFGDPFTGVGEAMARIKQRISQSLFACYLGGGTVQDEETAVMHEAGVPVFSSPEACVTAIRALTDYGTYLRVIEEQEV